MKRAHDEAVAEFTSCHGASDLPVVAGLLTMPAEIVGAIQVHVRDHRDISALACTCTHIYETLYEQYTGNLQVSNATDVVYLQRYKRSQCIFIDAFFLTVESQHRHGEIQTPLSVRAMQIQKSTNRRAYKSTRTALLSNTGLTVQLHGHCELTHG